LKAWLCYIKTDPHDHALYKMRLEELAYLSKAAGFDIVGSSIQIRRREHPAFVVGRGKLDEIKQATSDDKVDAIIFYNVLTSKQKYNLTTSLGREILDRYDLTLRIFDLSSSDKLSKLQITLAKLIKEIPYERLVASIRYKTGKEHPGPKSLGEYSYHEIVAGLLKRRSNLQEEISRKKREKLMQLSRRKRMNIPTACIAGYYSAGKTSLFNALTNLNKAVGPKPFTTLSSKYYLLPDGKRSLFVADTIGFVADLDPRLIASFSLTLEDIRASDIVILVVDVSDPIDLMKLRIETCLDLLRKLGIGDRKIVLAFNKCDLLTGQNELQERVEELSPTIKELVHCGISAKTREGLKELMMLISSLLIEEAEAPA